MDTFPQPVAQCFYCDALLSDAAALIERRTGMVTCSDCADYNRALLASSPYAFIWTASPQGLRADMDA